MSEISQFWHLSTPRRGPQRGPQRGVTTFAEDRAEEGREELRSSLRTSPRSSPRSSAVHFPKALPYRPTEIWGISGVSAIYFGNSKLIKISFLMKRNPCHLYWYSPPSVQKRLTQCLIRNVTLLCAHINDPTAYSDGVSLELTRIH